MLLAAFAWGYTTNNIGAIFNGIFGIKRGLAQYLSRLPSRDGILMSETRTALPVNPTGQRSVLSYLSGELSPYLDISP